MRALFFGGPMNGQERVANGDQHFRDVLVPDGQPVRYELLLRYDNTLLYSYQLSLWQVYDLLVNKFFGEPT